MKYFNFFIVFLLTSISAFPQQAGNLDVSFGDLGITVIDFDDLDDVSNSAVIQWNGQIILGGTSVDGVERHMSIARLTPLGNLDPAFSDDGKHVVELSGYNETGSEVFMQRTRIVLAGYSEDGYYPRNFVMYRFHSGDGSIDWIFGDNGRVATDFSGNDSQDGAYASAVRGSKIFLAGGTDESGSNSMFGVAKYNLGGDLDYSFGSSGLVITDFATMTDERVNALALQPDGKIIAVGESASPYPLAWNWVIARYNPDGTMDNTFGNNGRVVQYWAGLYDGLDDVVLLPDGKFLVAGTSEELNTVIARYNSDGSLDTTFGSSGKTQLQGVNASIALYGNKIFSATSLHDINSYSFTLSRFNYDGTTDDTFGNGGYVSTVMSDLDAGVTDLNIQNNGRILLTGFLLNQDTFNSDYVAVRYYNDPVQPNIPFFIVDDLWNQGYVNFSDLGNPAVTEINVVAFPDSIPSAALNTQPLGSGFVNRFYDVTLTPENAGANSDYSASLRFYYREDELQGIDENVLRLYRYDDGNWTNIGGVVNTSENYIEASGLNKLGIFAIGNPAVLGNRDSVQPDNVEGYYLSQNYPNPFNPSTLISFTIPKGNTFTSLKVYNSLGEEICILFYRVLSAGNHQVEFNAEGLPGGVYFYNLSAGSYNESKKMILLK